ncbi:hypothetical protein CAP35_13770 [Chitinophagaceae bacterium IBVUCB1]|nr:hypothetical protein CAP35_13770 [Chitinophagaceae bacterium IBVUCB1]
MPGTTVRKNGKAYDSGDVVITLFNQQEDEVAEIEYYTEQEHQINHSLANVGTSWSMGKITNRARLVLYMNAARKIENAANGDLLKVMPFEAQVTFLNEFNEVVNDTVTWKFQSQGRKVDGSMGLKMEYDMFCLGVSYNNL